MSLYKQYETDSDIEKQGVLFDTGSTNSKGNAILIRIARAGGANDAYLKRMEVRFKPHQRALQANSMERKRIEALVRETFAETVVLGWENMEDRDGNELPFSKENCIKLFEELPDLFGDLQDAATKASLFRKEIQESSAKN